MDTQEDILKGETMFEKLYKDKNEQLADGCTRFMDRVAKNKRPLEQRCKECGIKLQAGGQFGYCDCCFERGQHSKLAHQAPEKRSKR